MSRRIAIAASLVLVGASASAQQELDASHLVPITAPVQDLGTFNWVTKRWVTPDRANALRAATTTVYNNTCTWTGANFYSNNSGQCTTYIDEGRIPSPSSPNAPAGATTDNNIVSFNFAYCTSAATGTVDIKVGFYDNLGGGCLQGLTGVPYATPISTNAVGYFDFGAAAGFPLPGGGCWSFTVTLGNNGFCMQSDGDGDWDNFNIDTETFGWSFESDTAPAGTAASTGPVLAGDSSLSGVGGCTYNVPCGTDPSPLFAAHAQCGHGLDTEDRWWVNHDGDLWGDLANTGQTCPGTLPSGSNCYWFGGYPGNPFASFHLVLGSSGSCGGCNGTPTSYCTAGTTSAASGSCVAVIGLRAGSVPSASNAAPAFIDATSLPGQKNGLIFLGLGALANTPWGPNGHFLCIAPPTQRTLNGNTNGTTGACDGQISLNINQELANFGILGQTPANGQVVYSQAWFRDPGSSKTTAMTNGLSVTLCP